MQGWDDVLPATWKKVISTEGWTKGLPQKEGHYWLYGYRYGEVSCGTANKPELLLAQVYKISNGLLIVADGQFVYGGEMEKAWHREATIPNVLPY